MGAVALSQPDEVLLDSLKKNLKIASKSQVVHRALKELEASVNRGKLAVEITQSAKKCGAADLQEHAILAGAAIHRQTIS